jgi:hypothetical protein
MGESVQRLRALFDSEFQRQVSSVVNFHGSDDVSEQIVEALRNARLGELTKKEFFDWTLTRKHE